MWFYITVHDTFGVAEVKRFKDLKHVKTDVKVSELLVKSAEIVVTSFNVLHDKCRCLGEGITNDIDQVDNIDATSDSLENFDFSSDLRFLDWLQNFNDD